MNIPLPTDINQLASWFLIPAVLAAIATAVVNAYAANRPDTSENTKMTIKLAVYVLLGAISYFLQLVPPDVLAKFSVPFGILITVIAAFVGAGAFHVVNRVWLGAQLIGLRVALGRDHAVAAFTANRKGTDFTIGMHG